MKTPQASILSTIKAIRSSKKRADELTLYKFIKRELQSITNEEITDTLKTLCDLGLIENKPSNHLPKFYHLLLKMKLILSLPAMLRIMIMIPQKH